MVWFNRIFVAIEVITIAVVGGWFFYQEFKRLRRELKEIDNRHNQEMAKIDADHKARMAELDAQEAVARKKHEKKMAKLKAAHDYQIRKINELEFDNECVGLRTGDWVTWIPVRKPLRERYGQIIGIGEDAQSVKIRFVIGRRVEESYHKCSVGAKMRKMSDLDLLARELNAKTSALDGS